MKSGFKWAVVLVGAHLAIGALPANAQQYPTRPIEDSVWASAGGGTDLVNRLIAKAMEKELGGKINVVNRTGGGGGVAMDHVWSQPHDGYSWLGASEAMQNTAVMGFHPSKTKDWRWYMVAGAPASVAVRANSPYKTIDDLVKAAQANPGKVNVSHCPIGCVFHLKWIALADAAKMKVNYVPYEGSAPAMVAALSGEADAVISSISEQAEYIKAGRLRTLGMVEMAPFEFAGQGSIPAIGAKFPDIAKMPARQWLGFAVPADTPKAVTDRIDAAFVKAMQDGDLKKIAHDRYLNLFGAYGDESMKILSAMESAVSWKLQELGVAKISPEKLGIAKP
ncbi:MAG: tripartite tricarboxylate transporter substrate binding protein [Betaproteobacteria bacterium]